MDIIDRYEKRIFDMYMATHPNAQNQQDKVRTLIRQFTENNIRDVPCQLKNNITHEVMNTSMLQTFDWIDNRDPIISGNGTFFKQHEEYLGPSVIMLEQLMKNRDKKKKIMYSFDEKSVEYANAKTGQLSVKVIMNADYGGCGTPLSPFFSQYIPPATTGSAKNLTTTLICCLELMSNNQDKWAKLNSFNELMDMIYSVLEDTEERPLLIEDEIYDVNLVLQHLVSITNNLSITDIKVLKSILEATPPKTLSKIMCCYNCKYVMRKYLDGHIEKVMAYFKSHPVDLSNMTKESIYESGYGGKGAPDSVKEDVDFISKTIVDNCVYSFMPNDAEVRAENMKRVIVCVTDTDSLMLHFANYIEDFHATSNAFRDSCLLASALGMRIFIDNVMPKMVSFFARHSRIRDKYYRDKFIFKNEFAFLSMTLLAKKMYSASMFVQEGNPRDPHKIAITGLSFKKRDAAEFLEPIMEHLYDKYILTTNKIDVEGILDEYYALRERLKSLVVTDPAYLKKLSIKDIGAYDASKVLPAQMRGAIVWNNIMPDEEMLPMDRVIVIQLSWGLLDQYQSQNPKAGEIIRLSSIDDPNRKREPVICIPEHYKSIPDWIRPLIDVDFTLDKILSPFKQLFALFDVNMPETRGGMIPSRMIYL